jgi:hypothetical protein
VREQRQQVLGRELGIDVRRQGVEERDDRVEQRLERGDEADAEVVLLVDRGERAAEVLPLGGNCRRVAVDRPLVALERDGP